MPTGDVAALCAALSDEEVLEAYERQLKKNKTPGVRARPQLETVRKVLGAAPLRTLALDPHDLERRLCGYFRSALARHQHIRVVLTLVQGLGKRVQSEALQAWRAALATAARESDAEQQGLRAYFAGSEASEASIDTYVKDTHRLLAKLNAPNLHDVLVNPGRHRELLRRAAPEEGTAANHVQKLAMFFNLSATLREQHPDACAAWRAAAAEHSLRAAERYKANEPNPRQASNFVVKASWVKKLDERLAESDPHETLAKSQATVLTAVSA